jgi:hypothetical protein
MHVVCNVSFGSLSPYTVKMLNPTGFEFQNFVQHCFNFRSIYSFSSYAFQFSDCNSGFISCFHCTVFTPIKVLVKLGCYELQNLDLFVCYIFSFMSVYSFLAKRNLLLTEVIDIKILH